MLEMPHILPLLGEGWVEAFFLLLIQQPSARILSFKLGTLLSSFGFGVIAACNYAIEGLAIHLSLCHAAVIALTCKLLHESHAIALDGDRCHDNTILFQGAAFHEGDALVADCDIAIIGHRSCGNGSHSLSGYLLNWSCGSCRCHGLRLLSLSLLISFLIGTFLALARRHHEHSADSSAHKKNLFHKFCL